MQASAAGAAASQVDPKQLQDAASQLLLKQAAGAGGPALNTLSLLQQRRAERLDLAARDLQAKYGNEGPGRDRRRRDGPGGRRTEDDRSTPRPRA